MCEVLVIVTYSYENCMNLKISCWQPYVKHCHVRLAPTPYEGSWKDLANRYPKGKVLKISSYFYEVVSISIDFVTDTVSDNTFIETDLYKADIYVKPYGSNGHGDNVIGILFTPDPEVLKRW